MFVFKQYFISFATNLFTILFKLMHLYSSYSVLSNNLQVLMFVFNKLFLEWSKLFMPSNKRTWHKNWPPVQFTVQSVAEKHFF